MPIALAHLAGRGELPMTRWGFRAYAGPFERLGHQRFGLLGAAFITPATSRCLAPSGSRDRKLRRPTMASRGHLEHACGCAEPIGPILARPGDRFSLPADS